MKVSSVSSINSPRQRPNFKSYGKSVYNSDSQHALAYRTTTFIFRKDLDWNDFVDLLDNKYKKASKVNIIDYACSIGTESFCLAAKLVDILGDGAEKFFPIIAKDIDSENIKIAKSNILKDDFFGIADLEYGLGKDYNRYFGINYNKYFEIKKYKPESCTDADIDIELIPKPFLQKKVKFQQANIIDDIDNCSKSNSVILFRNAWPYLKSFETDNLIDKFVNYFDDTCLFVIGRFDAENNIETMFKRKGLMQTKVYNVWTK